MESLDYPLTTTIAAISTPLGPGGIGIIRISGPAAGAILDRVFLRSKDDLKKDRKGISGGRPLTSHLLVHGYVIEPAASVIIDEVLAVFMKAPKSFTREDVVEIHSHSGFLVLEKVLCAVLDAGADLAQPGEFSKRAFLNGRIDLSQAEAVMDLINAPCETALQMAALQMRGGLGDIVRPLTEQIRALQAQCEAQIEMVDEEAPNENRRACIQQALVGSVVPQIEQLVQRFYANRVYRDGLSLVIVGVPNVGKSSLLNALVSREAAIVSEIPGTTRDVVREFYTINGVPVVVCDTAGIHDTTDPVERLGIEKTHAHLKNADVVLVVVEAGRQMSPAEVRLVEENTQKNAICVINKVDLCTHENSALICDVGEKWPSLPQVRVSAKTGFGIEDLKNSIVRDVGGLKQGSTGQGVTPNFRQRRVLERALGDLQHCCFGLDNHYPIEVVVENLNAAVKRLDEVVGHRDNDALYDHLFEQFCVGK